jgi:hypothetical protein
VLERKVTWDRVGPIVAVGEIGKPPVPKIFRLTTGREYGMEISVFLAALTDPAISDALGIDADIRDRLKFDNLQLQYQLVYYLPSTIGEAARDNTLADALAAEAERLDQNFKNWLRDEAIGSAWRAIWPAMTDGAKEAYRAAFDELPDPNAPVPGPLGWDLVAHDAMKLLVDDIAQRGLFYGEGMGVPSVIFGTGIAPLPRLRNQNRFDLGESSILYRYELEDLDPSTWVTLGSLRTGDGSNELVSALNYYNSTIVRTDERLAITGEGEIGHDSSPDPVYKKYFEEIFNAELITFIPVLYNFYLTNSQFPKADGRFEAPKQRIIQIFNDSVHNENALVPVETPRRPQTSGAGSGIDDPLSDIGISARDFILRMLIETPIEILRGLAEMLDPHVGISKLIRDITGALFSNMAKGIDMAPPVIALREGGPVNTETGLAEPPPLAPSLNGDGILELLLCALTIGMKKATEDAPKPDGMDDSALFPKITMKGVDFTGTVPGIFMLLPFIFGIPYLLLSLLKKELEDIMDEPDEPPDQLAPGSGEEAEEC